MRSPLVVLAVVVSLLALGCPGQKPPAPPVAPGAAAEEPLVWKMSKSGLGFRLSNADEEADHPRERSYSSASGTRYEPRSGERPLTPSTAIAAADARKLASRLPELKQEPDDSKDFALRAKSLPAPRPGKTVSETFPPPAGGPPPVSAASHSPLKLERHAPEGPVEIAPQLTMTFSEPMVPVTAVSDGALTEHPPVRLSPEPKGKWRWLGSRTLLFQPDTRFPMATDYRVEVPAGTRALSGQTLAQAVRWTFTTPPPVLKGRFPDSSSQPLDPLIFAEFDQAIEPQKMLASIELEVGAGARDSVPLRLAEPDEIEANDAVRRLSQHAEKGRWLAFRAASKLKTATTYDVRVKTGAHGAEGPRPTDKDQAFTFSTFGPMRVTHSSCREWRNGKEVCPPLAPWSIGFSNGIEPKTFDKSMVTVSPEVPGLKIEVMGSTMMLHGRTNGRTKYAVSLAGTLPDVHGQTLKDAAKVVFDVGSAEPTMFGAEQDMIVLDPGQKTKDYRVYSINEPGLHTRIYAVGPEDWSKFVAYRQEWERPRKLHPPGRLVFDKTIAANKGSPPDELVATPIDLGPALTSGLGQALVVVEPTHPLPKGWSRPELAVWVQSTELGLDAMIESDQVTSWATRLADGTPLADVDVQLLGAGTAKTDGQGLARVLLGPQPGHLVVARKGKDVVIMPEAWFGQGTYTKVIPPDSLRWLVYDDRGMYKPGEEVRIKGWVRRSGGGRDGDIDAIPNVAGTSVTYHIRDPRYAELGTGSAKLDELGSFDFSFKLPDNANLGYGTIELTLPGGGGGSASHRFHIEEFRRPEFEVTAVASEGPHLVGKHAIVTLSASYYSGGGLPDAPVDWHVTRRTSGFTPPNRGDYHFGPEPESFWSWRANKDEKTTTRTETWTAKTNPQGVHRLRVDFDAVEPPYPMTLDLVGTVTDVNRQAWTGRTSVLVHPASDYVGLKPSKNFLRAGENIELDAVIVDVDGKPSIARHATVTAARIESEQVHGGAEHEEKQLEVQTCEIDSAKEKSHCTFKTEHGGAWRIWAVVADEHGRKSQSTTSVWVMGAERPKDRSLTGAKAEMLLDKKEYHPGDLAELLVVAPFAPAEGLLTIRRQGVVHVERFTMKTTSTTLKVKLEETLVPNAELRVDLVGQDVRENSAGSPDRALPKRPAFAVGSIGAKVLAENRTLRVEAVAKRPTLEPGAKTDIEVVVTDHGGHPVADGEVAVVVADEAVLALSGYQTPDPIAVFYAPRPSGVRDLGMRDHVLLGEPDVSKLRATEGRADDVSKKVAAPARLMLHKGEGGGMGGRALAAPMAPGAMPAPAASVAAPEEKPAADKADLRQKEKALDREGPSGAAGEEPKTPIAVRADFSALALFSPRVRTDAHGRATVPVKLPDNLTRYRVMAVAATKDRSFGSTESTITARLPIMVRPSAPRFLNFGDKFELPVVIQNQTDQPLDVGVVARATNATVDEPSAKRVRVPPNDRAEVRFAAATVKPGKARFQVGASVGSYADASEVELPVWTPATTEAFATYGEIDGEKDAVAQMVKMPQSVFPQFGGLEITTSSTQLQALTDAVVYLVKYPFECNEQLSSRVLSIAALRDVLRAFKSKDLPAPAALEASMKDDFEKLKRRQHYSGGWGFWQEEPWPYLSIHVAHALTRAADKGYKPDESMMQRSRGYLRSIESHIPGWYPPDARRAIIAYALYVRNRMKDPDPARAKQLMAEAGGVDKLPIEAVGWIWPTISADKASAAENEAIRRHVDNRVTETAGAAHFVSGYRDADYVLLSSDRRADGVLLEAMIGDEKDSTVIPKLVKGLLAHRKAGRWLNTQENAFVLLALDRYFATYENVTPDFVSRVWLGDQYAGEHAFKGRTTEFSDVAIPMQFLAASGPREQNLIVGKDGPGRLYYRIGMQYAPTDLKLPPADYGFVVSRLYEAVDQPDDVRRDRDGTWRVKAGAKVRVRVTMVAPSRRYHVALVDWLPAGLEAMNPSLAVTGEIPKDPKVQAESKNPYWYWQRTWYEHQNMRDERVEAFSSLLWDGVWDYSYVARATTPGAFVVPPAKAEEMYSPETFGRSGGDKLIVE